MRLLLDSHALIWWFAGSSNLPQAAREAIEDPAHEVFVSAVSAWEMATKHRMGRLPTMDAVMRDLAGAIAAQGFQTLPITLRHAIAAGALPGPHRDPFDRMLMAQAALEDMWLVSNEAPFDAYGVRRLWS